MNIIPFRQAGRKPSDSVRFRCIACRVAFEPRVGQTEYCDQCTAGDLFYKAAINYQRSVGPGQGRR